MFKVLENANQERDRRIAHFQTDARLDQAVIDGLREQTNRDADIIDFFDNERKAYEPVFVRCAGSNKEVETGPPTSSIVDKGSGMLRSTRHPAMTPRFDAGSPMSDLSNNRLRVSISKQAGVCHDAGSITGSPERS
ncbi:hypothetical protein B9Z55_026417 [Caenorhabditis nigoni]|uniref:Uncharacterized protein n=1 Tax=Caenorhabditis nigoni TaxID=1611254 RepID=A0A2G5T2Z7_9PELO|nr:hypothetical protein B9Z55_026417 [Caenorhabditis nigoni]